MRLIAMNVSVIKIKAFINPPLGCLRALERNPTKAVPRRIPTKSGRK